MSKKVTKIKNEDMLPSYTVKTEVSQPASSYVVNEQPVTKEEFQRTYPDAIAVNPIFLDTKKILEKPSDEVVTEVYETTEIEPYDKLENAEEPLPKKTPELFRAMKELKKHADYISSMPLSLITRAAAKTVDIFKAHNEKADKHTEEALKELQDKLDEVLKPIFEKYRAEGFGFGLGPGTKPTEGEASTAPSTPAQPSGGSTRID